MRKKQLKERLETLRTQNDKRLEALRDESKADESNDPRVLLSEITEAEKEISAITEQLAAIDALEAKAQKHVESKPRAAATAHNLAEDRPWGGGGMTPLADFLCSVKLAEDRRRSGDMDPRLFQLAPQGINESVATEGGFLVPIDMENDLRERGLYTSQIAPRCARRNLTGNTIRINGINETSRVDGSRFGGVRAYWQGEAQAATATKPTFDQINLELKKLTAMVYVTEEQLQDTAFMASEVADLVPQELAFALDNAIINGTGAGQPLGILNATALASQAKESGQTATTVVFANVAKMMGRMVAGSLGNAVWLINQDVMPHLITMASAATSAAIPVFLPGGNISGAPFGTLFGRPVIPVEQCQTIGTKGDILLVDLSKYILAMKASGVDQKSSMHVRFAEGELAYRFVMRVDGQPRWRSALTPKNGSNTQSPFVSLDTRS